MLPKSLNRDIHQLLLVPNQSYPEQGLQGTPRVSFRLRVRSNAYCSSISWAGVGLCDERRSTDAVSNKSHDVLGKKSKTTLEYQTTYHTNHSHHSTQKIHPNTPELLVHHHS